MKLFVTGGAGFIGSNFIHYWLKKYPRDEIINFDKLTYAGNLDNLLQIKNNPSYHFIKGDICNLEQVNLSTKGVDIIVHFAAESHVDRSITDPGVFVETNIVGTQRLLESALKNKIKHFHHISTDEVFGSLELDNKSKFNELTVYNPRSPYSASKAGSDHLVRSYYHTYGLPVTITNCSNNFGPYQHPEKLIPLAITNVLEEKKIPIYGDGLNCRDWLFVEDHCRAIDLVVREGKKGETYCIGGLKKEISNLELAMKILKLLGKDKSYLEFIDDRLGHDRKYSIDWTKAQEKLGWQPEHDLDTWLEKTVGWYKNNSWWWIKLKQSDWDRYYKKHYKGGLIK
jgi:dTDP-glucose 4,6-dehydratase